MVLRLLPRIRHRGAMWNVLGNAVIATMITVELACVAIVALILP
jgi:hypothetical protein